MSNQPWQIVRASAGTGKTFALSNRFLRLVHAGASPGSILATTFTRKAAGEILQRVMLRLARATASDKAAASLGHELGVTGLDAAGARGLLARLCESMHRLSVSTIDGFFNRVAQSFRHELGIPPSPTMVGSDAPQVRELRLEAIAAVLADESLDVLLDLMRRLQHDAARRSVTDAIDEIVSSLYDVYRQAPEAVKWARLPAETGLGRVELVEAIDRLAAQVAENKNKTLALGLKPNLEAAYARDWINFLTKGLTPKIDLDPPVYRNVTIPEDWRQAYRPLIGHARAELIGRVARRTQAMHQLLARFDTHFTRLRQTRRIMLFSDLPHKLARELPRLEDLETELYYRLDSRVIHVMLDEFQDTSVEQWQVLRPIAQEIRQFDDGSRSFFCVGDVKQAIYGWRGGCREVFEQVEADLYLDKKHRVSLDRNYRSSPHVLEAVDRVFGSISKNPAMAKFAPVTTAWQDSYRPHVANNPDQPGYVELATTADPPSPDAPDVTSDRSDGESEGEADADIGHEAYVARRVGEIASGAAGLSIGVLVSTNDMVRRMIFRLRGLGLNASGEGGNPVTDDPAVNTVLAMLQLADHPGDTAAAFTVVNSPLGAVVGLRSMRPEAVAEASRAVRRRLVEEGGGAVVADWSRALAASCDARNLRRLEQLVEIVEGYQPRRSLRTRELVDHIAATAVEEPSASPIRVMTIHKAKGLEFDAVVMLQLTRLMGAVTSGGVYVSRPSPTDPIDAVYAGSSGAVRELCPPLAAAFEQEMARRVQDDLCSLYVGMTRARHALHLYVPPLRESRRNGAGTGKPTGAGLTNATAASVLRSALCPSDLEEGFDGGQTLYQTGDPHWAGRVAAPGANREEPTPRRARMQLQQPGETGRRSWASVSPSALEGYGRIAARDLLRLDASATTRGEAIHALFQRVGWLEDFVADDGIRNMPCFDEFETMLGHSEVRRLLSRGDRADAELWRERAFAVRVAGRLVSGSFDRVEVDRAARQARIIDFKTDRATDAAVDHYRPQLEAYRAALAAMLGWDPARIETTLLFVGTGRAVTLTPGR